MIEIPIGKALLAARGRKCEECYFYSNKAAGEKASAFCRIIDCADDREDGRDVISKLVGCPGGAEMTALEVKESLLKVYPLYAGGTLYNSLESARKAARGKLGARVSMRALLEAADIRHPLAGPRGEASVTWKPPLAEEREEPPGRAPLLRYPPGEGPLHGSRPWR
jgi:hypothetical protein